MPAAAASTSEDKTMKVPLPLRFRGGASTTERGPSARRGMQFSDAELPELIERLARVRATLRRLDSLGKDDATQDDEIARLRALSASDLEALRKEQVMMQSDLRAELRRRGAY
jgi:hypothetical protein